jgi:hypothetical protein
MEAVETRTNCLWAGHVDQYWFTPNTNTILKSKAQVRRFIDISNELGPQFMAKPLAPGETWLLHVGRFKRMVAKLAMPRVRLAVVPWW